MGPQVLINGTWYKRLGFLFQIDVNPMACGNENPPQPKMRRCKLTATQRATMQARRAKIIFCG
jgi:hypothetical protein